MEEDMVPEADGQGCMLVLFEEPGGEIASIFLLEGVLAFGSDGTVTLVNEEGGALPIPAHLADAIEEVTDEHRECIEDLAEIPYCLRASYDGRLNKKLIADLESVLRKCSGPPTAE
jgi:hypothetical protein